ncbi:SPW repeat protein [Pontibacter sp. CAU 1760]
MRFIPTRFHGMLDYVVGMLFLLAPWIFSFSDMALASWVMVIAGIAVLALTVLTDFEVGIIRKTPMKIHLIGDFGLGALLAASPWMLDFAAEIYSPHLIGGIFAILASLTTHRIPSESYRNAYTQHQNLP